VTIKKHSEGFLPQGTATRRGAGKLIATAAAEPALRPADFAGFDDMLMSTFRTGRHDFLLITPNPLKMRSYITISLLGKYSRFSL
jgi:hypothetical protein